MVRTYHLVWIVLKKPKLVGRMIAWSVELSKFRIKYKPKGPMKAQCLADFVVKLTTTTKVESLWWKLYVDGSSNEKVRGARVILASHDEVILEQSLQFEFKTMNNQVEYEAILAGLRLAKEVGAKHLKYWSDSKLVTGKLNEDYHTKDPQMTRYYHMATWLEDAFINFQFQHIVRENNGE